MGQGSALTPGIQPHLTLINWQAAPLSLYPAPWQKGRAQTHCEPSTGKDTLHTHTHIKHTHSPLLTHYINAESSKLVKVVEYLFKWFKNRSVSPSLTLKMHRSSPMVLPKLDKRDFFKCHFFCHPGSWCLISYNAHLCTFSFDLVYILLTSADRGHLFCLSSQCVSVYISFVCLLSVALHSSASLWLPEQPWQTKLLKWISRSLKTTDRQSL